jgi:phosphopantothenoylcysteine decarboxylase/phosphopantothenate--cysteine ligase
MTGGVACYKVAELTRALGKAGAHVQVVMTQAATQFITPVTMQALSGNTVFTDQWDARIHNNMPHIDLTRDADAIIIAPCSTDFMFKLAHGACDDLLSTLCIARPRHVPLLIAPAMNVEMWQNAATQRNVAQIEEDGIQVLGPAAGDQACGETGMGRMLEPEQLLTEIIAAFQPKILAGKHLLITAGPTFEPIDPVRGITNLSSGKMGYAIALAAWEAGAQVTLVSGPTALEAPHGVRRIHVQTALQMHDAVLKSLAQNKQDIFVAVAAVADWRVANASEHKLKKRSTMTRHNWCLHKTRTFWPPLPRCPARLTASALQRSQKICWNTVPRNVSRKIYRCWWATSVTTRSAKTTMNSSYLTSTVTPRCHAQTSKRWQFSCWLKSRDACHIN